MKKFDEIGAKVARKQELTQQIKAHESELESLEAERQELFQKNATVILGGILFERFNRDKSGQSSAPYLTTAIQQYLEHLLSDDHCICGEPMSPEHRQHVLLSFQISIARNRKQKCLPLVLRGNLVHNHRD